MTNRQNLNFFVFIGIADIGGVGIEVDEEAEGLDGSDETEPLAATDVKSDINPAFQNDALAK